MNAAASPQKRPRVEDDQELPSLPTVSCRSEELFLADGNIILLLTHYKVHKAVLGLNCAAFKDLLEGMSDDAFGDSEMFEGVPVMDTHDEQEDLDVFLKAIYLHDWVHTSYETDPKGFLHTFGRLLKLAKKYDAVSIRQTVTKLMQKEWPSEYWAWEHVALPAYETYPGRRWARDPVIAIRLGRDYDIPEILPAAMYELCVLYELYDHTLHPTGDVPDNWAGEAGDWPDPMTKPLDLSSLDVEDYRRLWLGRGALHSRWFRKMHDKLLVATIEPFVKNLCDSSATCAHAFDKSWSSFQRLRLPATHPNPFSCIMDIRLHVQSIHCLCDMCKDGIVNSLFDPVVLWGDLPAIFDLPQALPPSW